MNDLPVLLTREGLNAKIAELEAENAQLRAERDYWEAICSGSIKEQFRLARENEARLKLALEQLDKAATEIRRLNGIISAGADRKK